MKIVLLVTMHAIALNAFTQLKPVGSGVFHWNALTVKKNGQRESRKLMEGTTREFEYFEIHATTREKGAVPKQAHTQQEIEELIILKEGSMKAVIGNKTVVLG